MNSGTIRRRQRARLSDLAQQRQAVKQERLESMVQTRRGLRPSRNAGVGDSSTLSKEASGLANPFGKGTPIASATVKEGDTLSDILSGLGYKGSDMYAKNEEGLSLIDRIASANGLKNANLIKPGQKLTLPALQKPEASEKSGGLDGLLDGLKSLFGGEEKAESANTGTRYSRRLARREAAAAEALAEQSQPEPEMKLTRRGMRRA